jgi:PAS domain S-box-containing protein
MLSDNAAHMAREEESAATLVVTSPDDRICFWSAAAAARFGWTAEEALGRELGFLLPQPGAAFEAGRSECVLQPKNGGTLDCWRESSALRDENGAVYCMMHLFKPLSASKQAEREALKQASTTDVPVSRKQIHDLNNLLTSVHSSLDLALHEGLRPELHRVLAQAQVIVRRAAQLANSFRGTPAQPPSGASPLPAVLMPAKPEPGAEPYQLEGTERILIAEDDKNTRMLMRAILAYRGYQVTEAADGAEAIAAAQTAALPYDLAILDINMPGLSGPEVFTYLRRKNPGLKVIFLSGSPEEFQALAFPAGVQAVFLAKPFENLELLQMVRRVASGASPAQE